jgi:hypothetical protein
MVIKAVTYLVLRAVRFLLAPNLQGSFLRHRMKLLKEEETSISTIRPRRVLRKPTRYLLNSVNIPISVGIWPLRLVLEISTASVKNPSPRNAELC